MSLRSKVVEFKTSLSEFKGEVASSTPVHPMPRGAEWKFTFDPLEVIDVLRTTETQLAVHHGSMPKIDGLRTLHLLDEHLVPFLPKSRARLRMCKAQLAGIVTGSIADWSQLGLARGAIRILAHGGPINVRVLECYTRQLLGISLPPRVEFLRSYEELSDVAIMSNNCIVFGLRPAFIDVERLVPASIDGIGLWETGRDQRYPRMPIHLVWRDDVHSSYLADDYLEKVKANLIMDAKMLDAIGQTMEVRCKEYSFGGRKSSLSPAALYQLSHAVRNRPACSVA
jgi:hypothetical protein